MSKGNIKTLAELLREIGKEANPSQDEDGTVCIRSNDEQLARLIWQRALGYSVTVEQSDGTQQHKIVPPDPKAQEFIFARREGTTVDPSRVFGGQGQTAADRVEEQARLKSNRLADEMAIDDDGPSGPDRIDGDVSGDEEGMD